MFDANIDWKFQSELFLENFVWETLESLLTRKKSHLLGSSATLSHLFSSNPRPLKHQSLECDRLRLEVAPLRNSSLKSPVAV